MSSTGDGFVDHQHAADGARAIRWIEALIVLLWVALMVRLMIADVWDETNGLLVFGDPSRSIAEVVRLVWTTSMGFWRPAPAWIASLAIRITGHPAVAWRLLRALNMAMLLGALVLIRGALQNWGVVRRSELLGFSILFLFSGSAIICAGWYANIFDASALLVIAIGMRLLSVDRLVAAGFLFGSAFFFKETAALVLPFLVLLVAMRRIDWRSAWRIVLPAVVLGGLYFLMRSQRVGLGSTQDVHQFRLAYFWPSLLGLCESFWRQTMNGTRGFVGFAFLALSIGALRGIASKAAALLFVVATAFVYWGMFLIHRDGELIHHLNFVGRLYLIPAVLMLIALVLQRRPEVLVVLAIPIVVGAWQTYRTHEQFQRAYKRLYTTAMRSQDHPFRVHYPLKPLDDPARNLKVGDFPEARYAVNTRDGSIVVRSP